MNMLFIINCGGKYQKKQLKGLEVIQNRANFPKLVAGDQAFLEKKRVLWQKVQKEFNTHAKVIVRRKVC